jgi:ferredoxin
MRVRLDRALCCGHGRCYALCPELFDEDDAGYAVLVAETVPRGLEVRARTAADNCPEMAISVED